MITFQDYCPTCQALVEATPAVGRNERRLNDEGLWLVLLNNPEALVLRPEVLAWALLVGIYET